MGVGSREGRPSRLVNRVDVDWLKIKDGQGELSGLVGARCPWSPHPPRTSRPIPVGTRWHATRTGPDTFDKRRRNGKQRAAGDLEGPLFWSRDTLPALSCRRYTHHATVARCSDYRCPTRNHLDITPSQVDRWRISGGSEDRSPRTRFGTPSIRNLDNRIRTYEVLRD